MQAREKQGAVHLGLQPCEDADGELLEDEGRQLERAAAPWTSPRLAPDQCATGRCIPGPRALTVHPRGTRPDCAPPERAPLDCAPPCVPLEPGLDREPRSSASWTGALAREPPPNPHATNSAFSP